MPSLSMRSLHFLHRTSRYSPRFSRVIVQPDCRKSIFTKRKRTEKMKTPFVLLLWPIQQRQSSTPSASLPVTLKACFASNQKAPTGIAGHSIATPMASIRALPMSCGTPSFPWWNVFQKVSSNNLLAIAKTWTPLAYTVTHLVPMPKIPRKLSTASCSRFWIQNLANRMQFFLYLFMSAWLPAWVKEKER